VIVEFEHVEQFAIAAVLHIDPIVTQFPVEQIVHCQILVDE